MFQYYLDYMKFKLFKGLSLTHDIQYKNMGEYDSVAYLYASDN